MGLGLCTEPSNLGAVTASPLRITPFAFQSPGLELPRALSLCLRCPLPLFVLQRLKPTNPAAQKALTTPTHYKLTPRPATRVRPKALQSAGSAKSQLFDGLDDDEPSLSNGAFMPK